jgi:hypothetical protein
MSSKQLVVSALVLAGALASGAAQARASDDVFWSVTIGSPVGVPVYRPPQPVYVRPAPVAVVPVRPYARHGYVQPTRWDHDGDGIPNRRDPVYNPRWDVDGDGIPNRRDPVYTPHRDRDGDGRPNWRERDDRFGDR